MEATPKRPSSETPALQCGSFLRAFIPDSAIVPTMWNGAASEVRGRQSKITNPKSVEHVEHSGTVHAHHRQNPRRPHRANPPPCESTATATTATTSQTLQLHVPSHTCSTDHRYCRYSPPPTPLPASYTPIAFIADNPFPKINPLEISTLHHAIIGDDPSHIIIPSPQNRRVAPCATTATTPKNPPLTVRSHPSPILPIFLQPPQIRTCTPPVHGKSCRPFTGGHPRPEPSEPISI